MRENTKKCINKRDFVGFMQKNRLFFRLKRIFITLFRIFFYKKMHALFSRMRTLLKLFTTFATT